jgi:uncharacterized protein
MKKACILSIDGGGIRGILPGVILAWLEKELQKHDGHEARISDYFDLIAGTSTGGILTCLYLSPDESGRPRFNATEAVDLYLEHGTKIFNLPWIRKISNPLGLFKVKYPQEPIETILDNYLKETKLSEVLKPCLITSYDFTTRKTVFFNKSDTTKGADRDFLLKDIARSTTAAPTYFKPSNINSLADTSLNLIDGGVFANNPAMCAYAEARTSRFSHLLNREDKPDYPEVKEMALISIGTGSHGVSYPLNKVNKWGVAGWIQPLIDILMSGNSETVHYQLHQMFETINDPECRAYYRLEPKLGNAASRMDLATQANLNALAEAGRTFISENKEQLKAIVKLLIENK